MDPQTLPPLNFALRVPVASQKDEEGNVWRSAKFQAPLRAPLQNLRDPQESQYRANPLLLAQESLGCALQESLKKPASLRGVPTPRPRHVPVAL